MARFSNRSIERLATCREEIQRVMNRAIQRIGFTIIEGHRNKETQEKYFKQGTSKLHYPYSNHNPYPSAAIDIIPDNGGYNASEDEWQRLAKEIKAAAEIEGVKIEWGFDLWKWDLPHWQLKKK